MALAYFVDNKVHGVVRKGQCILYFTYVSKKGALKKVKELSKDGQEYELISKSEFAARCSEEVEVINCCTGGKVKLRRVQLGTACDPSTERYHSM